VALNNSTKARSATLDDLRAILEEYGDRPAIVLGVAVAVKDARSGEESKVRFLVDLLDYVHRDLCQREIADDDSMISLHLGVISHKVCIEVVDQLLEQRSCLFNLLSEHSFPLRNLLRFLGEYPPLDGLRSKVRDLLDQVAGECVVAKAGNPGSVAIAGYPKLAGIYPVHMGLVVHALLCYQMFDQLKSLVKERVYEAIPMLANVVRWQLVVSGMHKASAKAAVVDVVRRGWGGVTRNTSHVAVAFRCIGDDSRVLRLLFNLAQAHIREWGLCYPVERLFEDR
jgi:hypothetical protein